MRYILLTIITYAYVILMFPLLLVISLIFMFVIASTKVVIELTEDVSISNNGATTKEMDNGLQGNGTETDRSRNES